MHRPIVAVLAVLPSWLTDEQGLTLATWFLFAATVGLLLTGVAAIFFAHWQLDEERNQRRVETLLKMKDDFDGNTMRGFRRRFARARLSGGKLTVKKDEVEFPECGTDVLDFFEHLAFLVRNRRLNPVQVWSVFGNWIGAYSQDLAAHIQRRNSLEKTAYEDFLWLVPELRQIDTKKQGIFFTHYSDQALERLYKYDSELE